MLNRSDINVTVYDIKELSTGLIKTSHRNQLLLLFQTEGVVEPHLVKKKHITEAVSDHVSDPNDHIDTSVVSASHTSTSDHFELAPRLIPYDVDSDSSNTSHPEPHPLGGAPDEFSDHMDSETLSDSEDNQESVAGEVYRTRSGRPSWLVVWPICLNVMLCFLLVPLYASTRTHSKGTCPKPLIIL